MSPVPDASNASLSSWKASAWLPPPTSPPPFYVRYLHLREGEKELLGPEIRLNLYKGVGEVRIVPTSVTLEDIIHSDGYAESMEDIRMGRVYKADSSEDMFKQSDLFG